jgi:phosphate starvation-inducible membrane PsiE
MQRYSKHVQRAGDFLVDVFHFLALFVIGATVIWSAVFEYVEIMQKGRAELKDILLLFIYLELGAMVGIYFKTRRLPVQFLIFIAITALARHLVIDVQKVDSNFHLYLLIVISLCIVVLTVAAFVLMMADYRYAKNCNELEIHGPEKPEPPRQN